MEEEIIYFYNVKDGKYYQSRYTHRWLNNLEQQCKKQKEVIDKAIEYITSYESISTIQGLTYIEANKQLDEKTMTEMTNRYLLVHDKLLEILEDKELEGYNE